MSFYIYQQVQQLILLNTLNLQSTSFSVINCQLLAINYKLTYKLSAK